MSDTWILGIASSHNGGVCLLHGEELVVAIQEERLLRQKRAFHSGRFASLSIEYCLEYAGISAEQLSAVVFCTSASNKPSPADVYLNPQLRIGRNGTKLFIIPHHFGHAVAVYALSGFTASNILIVDGNGSPWDELLPEERNVIAAGQLEAALKPGHSPAREHISLYRAVNGNITPIEKHIASYATNARKSFQTIGDMYGVVGYQIFGSMYEGPGKVMGLAPYGEPTIPVEDFYRIGDSGFEFQSTVSDRFSHDDRWPDRATEYANLAASVQHALEKAVLHLCGRFPTVKDANLSYAGGVALNSVANERIIREGGFKDVFIMPAAEDSGTAIGAAFYGLWQLRGYQARPKQIRDSEGRRYKHEEIVAAVRSTPGIVVRCSEPNLDDIVDHLADGKILGWFDGGSELGPRALGHRSIFSDPRDAQMKDLLNRVKFREGFRPFAPMITIEDVNDWFDVDGFQENSPFMLRVLRFRPHQAKRVPAVVHVDGTGRVQTVSKEASPRIHQLLTRFKDKTGIPILLNTSFNIAGEPIVETPADALWCFASTQLDYCVFDGMLVGKADGRDAVLDYPVKLAVQSAVLNGRVSDEGIRFDPRPLNQINEDVSSFHSSGRSFLDRLATQNPSYQLIITVPNAWGTVVHALDRAFLNILSLVDCERTGRDIYQQVISNSTANEGYSLSAFRRHLGILKRIGAISFQMLQSKD